MITICTYWSQFVHENGIHHYHNIIFLILSRSEVTNSLAKQSQLIFRSEGWNSLFHPFSPYIYGAVSLSRLGRCTHNLQLRASKIFTIFRLRFPIYTLYMEIELSSPFQEFQSSSPHRLTWGRHCSDLIYRSFPQQHIQCTQNQAFCKCSKNISDNQTLKNRQGGEPHDTPKNTPWLLLDQ